MKVRYDKENDVIVIIFSDNEITESDEQKPGLIFDYANDGSIVSIEVLNASKQMPFPYKVEYEVA
ncbi:MAG: DUF2283 domain-containing protein [Bacteroidota bacterium]